MYYADLIQFHCRLLNADVRMQQYRRAIHSVVRHGDVVLDLGCGSGILGLFACQAGAARVYAVERSPAIVLAKELAKANGFGDRIVHINVEAKELMLDDGVDVIVSELISKAVLGQAMSETISVCRDKFLKPGGRIVPHDVFLYVAPVNNQELFAKTQLPAVNVYDLDFSPMACRVSNLPISCRVPSESLIAPGVVAYHYDAYAAGQSDHFSTDIEFLVEKPSLFHGYVLWFVSALGGGVTLSNAPPGIAVWDNLLLPLPQAVNVGPGDIISLSLSGRDDTRMKSLWAWRSKIERFRTPPLEFNQSNFFACLKKN